ncbi:CHRD domain-containing protein [Ramlibacter ginsenosidimutans]|nr:CHRD domain-containing protein [Ramlibacter ginsenosidimutans]
MPWSSTHNGATHLGGTLTGAQEVPPVTSAGTGTLDASYDKTSHKLEYTVTYSGLSGPATAAHFHGPAAPGTNAGVIVPFANAASPIKGEATLTDAQAADLLAGRWYVNVHTRAHPGGEIRSQVTTR